MQAQLIFKPLAQEDYSDYLEWQRRFPSSSYVCLTTIGGMNTIDLHVRKDDTGLKTFRVLKGATMGFIKFTRINPGEGNASVSLLIPEGFEEHREYFIRFIDRFALDHTFHKLHAGSLETDRQLQEQLLKLGFAQEGVLGGQWYTQGRFVDLVMYGKRVGDS